MSSSSGTSSPPARTSTATRGPVSRTHPGVDQAHRGRDQGADHDAGRLGLSLDQRPAPQGARPIRLHPPVQALRGRAVALRRGRHRDRPREHRGSLRRNRVRGRPEDAEKLRDSSPSWTPHRSRGRRDLDQADLRVRHERIVEAAFDYAKRNGRKKVTAAHKANIMKFSDGLFLDTARQVAEGHPEVEFEDRIIDNLCIQLVSRPEEYDVIVLPNLYGDIVSDLGAGLIGGLGLAPGANIGTEAAMFEATHGSAPKYKGQNKVNPTALMLSGVLMLRHLGEADAADRMEGAIAAVIAEGQQGHLRPEAQPRRPDCRRHLRVGRRRDRGDGGRLSGPSRSPSPAPRDRSATRSCSGSRAGRCWGPRRRSSCGCSRSPCDRGSRRRGDGARRLRLPAARRDRDLRRPEVAFDGATSAFWSGAPARQGHGARRPAGGERRHLHAPGRGDQRSRRRRRARAGGRQPGEHQLPDRDAERPRRAAASASRR